MITHAIEVNEIRVYAHHGCLEEEAKIGQHYTIDVYLETNFTEAAEQDDLSKTIDYVTVNQIVEEEMAIRSKLIEQVGQRIVNRIKNSFIALQLVQVKIVKPCPPINGDVKNVAIIIKETIK
jgi:7,8-dihydroneopterin aldolase/epimerase/oxygenase